MKSSAVDASPELGLGKTPSKGTGAQPLVKVYDVYEEIQHFFHGNTHEKWDITILKGVNVYMAMEKDRHHFLGKLRIGHVQELF